MPLYKTNFPKNDFFILCDWYPNMTTHTVFFSPGSSYLFNNCSHDQQASRTGLLLIRSSWLIHCVKTAFIAVALLLIPDLQHNLQGSPAVCRSYTK